VAVDYITLLRALANSVDQSTCDSVLLFLHREAGDGMGTWTLLHRVTAAQHCDVDGEYDQSEVQGTDTAV
jgi:hypothetical protein